LPLAHTIAELHDDILETAADLRYDLDRGRADQVSDHHDPFCDCLASGLRDVDRHRRAHIGAAGAAAWTGLCRPAGVARL
jgi:hypothetical protein